MLWMLFMEKIFRVLILANWFNVFISLFNIWIYYLNFFSRAVRGQNLLYVSRGGIIHIHLSQRAVYRILAIDVRYRREGRDLSTVGFYDPITNQTFLNLSAILDFLKKGAQPTRTAHDISKKAGIFTEWSLTKTKWN